MTSDLRYAWRAIWKNPATTIGAMLALALGVGASSAVFGLVNAVLLRPLPYPHPERLVELYGNVQRERVERRGASYPDFFDWRDESRSFDGLASWQAVPGVLYGGAEPQAIQFEVISGPYFTLLGVEPIIGRVLDRSDDAVGGGARGAVITERLWERRFGRSPDVLGRAIQINSRIYTIVGVAPTAFLGRSDTADVWVNAAAALSPNALQSRGGRGFVVLARLKEGTSRHAAQAELDAICKRLEQVYPDTNDKRGVEISPLAAEIFGNLPQVSVLLSGAVALLLLIACANVASLLLARAEARRRELSVRMALGADRGRLARLMLAESAWLVLIGGGAGCALALVMSNALLAMSPVQLPSFATPDVDWRLLLFASTLGVVTTLVIGLTPVVMRSTDALSQELRDGTVETKGTRRSGALRAIVVGEVALAVALLVGATLLARSLTRLVTFDPGYATKGVLALVLQLPIPPAPPDGSAPAPPPTDGVAALALLDGLRALPGVTRAALASDMPLADVVGTLAIFYSAEGHEDVDARTRPRAYVHRITPGYFDTAGLAMIHGRDFLPTELAAGSTAVIVSEGVTRRFWPGLNPIGRRVRQASSAGDNRAPWLTIVGVVKDANLRGIPRNPTADPDLYFPFNERAQRFVALLRSDDQAANLTARARGALRRLDPQTVVVEAQSIESRVAAELAPVRFLSWLTGAFAAVAFALALIGIYALLAHAVRNRAREIGIRAALGASRQGLLSLVVGQGVLLVTVGLGVGLMLAALLSNGLQTWLFGIPTIDAASYAGVGTAVLIASVAASLVPALRAVRVDPTVALRNE
jgi:predicted permease